ncbi:MAG: methionyl-tRNA formyltransferase [Candidatus Daviesbacteria bacterium]|nr:methionyl-tRNA formyltransferase [Candidatus Daviesbacteria bacterium]
MKNNKLRIIFFGTPEFVVPVLEKLNENFEVVGVVTAPDKLVGRKQILTPSPVKTFIKTVMLNSFQHLDKIPKQVRDDILILTPEKLDADFISELQTLNPELFIVASYGKIIPQSVLDIPKFGSLNIHPSLLPKYRGPSPIQTAILNGDKISGVTILVVDNKMDHGGIIATEEISLSNTDTFDSLSKKMFLIGAELLVKNIPDFARPERSRRVSGKIKPQEQDHEKATFTKMFTKEDGYFDINTPNSELPTPNKLDRMIRAYYPWPTVWTKWNPSTSSGQAKIVKFLPSTVIPAKAGIQDSGSLVPSASLRAGKPGMTETENQNDKFLIQMEGKKAVKLADFLNGHPNFPIKYLK